MRRAVAGKARVHELAKELGVTSKDVLNKLKDLGEFVKSASSTVEAPVARRLRDSFPSKGGSSRRSSSAPAPAAPAEGSSTPKPGGGPKPGPAAPKPAPKAAQPAPEAPAAPAPAPV